MILHIFQDEEKNEIKDLIGSVILDSQVPGGLRWPLDKRHSPGGRYVVNSIGYTTAKSYMNSSIRFKFRHANRYKFESSTGEEVTQEIFMKMPGIVSELRVGSLFSMASNYVSHFILCFLVLDVSA